MARADLITFVLGGSLDGNLEIDDKTFGSLTIDGLTATFTANHGVLHATGSNFGIDADATSDATDLLDSGSSRSEFIAITFNQPVSLTQLTLDEFALGETAMLTIGLDTTQILNALAARTDVYDLSNSSFLMGNLIAPGQSLIVGSGIGNGFSLESLQVNTVPEPSCLSVAIPAWAGLLLRRKRRP